VIPEELAFRGVTWALLRRAGGRRVATLGSSVLFGLWHVLPALGGGPANETAAGALGEGAAGVAARAAGTVLVTFLAGLLLAALRAGSGSLLAPIGLHWAVNGAGIVLVHLVPS
jgi:membrane protease YdiL (CAAX protease family)